MIGFVTRRLEHEIADLGVAGEHGLGVIKRLCRDLSGMINAHQGRRLAFLIGGQGGIRLLGVAGQQRGGAGMGRAAAGGASRARNARSAAEIKVSRFGPVAMGRDYRPGFRLVLQSHRGLSTLAPLFPGARQH